MPDALKISTMSFRSQDGRSHPWVKKLYKDLFDSQWGTKIAESVEDTVILLSLFSCISFWISNQIRILDISLESFHVD